MRILKMARGTGKTQGLIKIAAERGGYIICRDRKEARRIFQSALNHELDIPFPITYADFESNNYFGAGIKEFLIDDVDELLVYLAQVPISYCTYTPS